MTRPLRRSLAFMTFEILSTGESERCDRLSPDSGAGRAGLSCYSETNDRKRCPVIEKLRWVFLAVTVAALACAPDRERQTAKPANDIPVGVYAALSGSE